MQKKHSRKSLVVGILKFATSDALMSCSVFYYNFFIK